MLDGPDHLLGYRAATSSVGGGKLWGQKFDLLAAEHVMLGGYLYCKTGTPPIRSNGMEVEQNISHHFPLLSDLQFNTPARAWHVWAQV